MGASKTDHFTSRQNKIANLCKAMAHPARVAIMDHLIKTGACICGDIVDKLPLAQPTVSQHLKELKTAGFIKGEIEGNSICYCIEEKALKEMQTFITAMLDRYAKGKNNCC